MIRKNLFFWVVIISLVVFDLIRIRFYGAFSLKPFLIVSLVVIWWGCTKVISFPDNFKYFVMWYLSLFIPLIAGTVVSYNQLYVILFGHALLTAFLVFFYNYLIRRAVDIRVFCDAIVIVGFISAVVALVQLLFFSVGINIGVTHFDTVGLPRPESLFSETDWYAMFIGYVLLYVFVMDGNSRFIKYKKVLFLFFMISIFLSFGRTALVGVLFCFLLYLVLYVRLQRKVVLFCLFSLLGMLFFIVFVNVAPESMINRFNIVGNIINPDLDSGAINSRFYSISMTLDYIFEEPFFGNGAGSINYLALDDDIRALYAYGGGINSGRGGTNIFLTSLFDSGIVGLVIIIVLLFVVALESYRYSKRNEQLSSYSKFAFLGFIYFVVECQANNMIRTPICWVHLSMMFYIHYLQRHRLVFK